MNRTLVFATLLAAGMATPNVIAQTAPAEAAPAPAAPAQTAPAPAPAAAPAPQAIPAKIAIIAFEQVAAGTNEGQKLVADLHKKFEPKETDIKNRAGEVDSLKKQLQALPASTPDEERAKRIKDIDSKDKRLQQDINDLQQEEQGEFQEGFGKLMQKVGPVAVKYAQDNGFTVLLNEGGNQNELPTVLWFNQSTDISQAVVNAYNVASGIAAPAPSAPAPRRTTPSTTTPKKPQ
jgi:outer membrane protein